MKKLLLALMGVLTTFSLYAGEVTGAGLTNILLQNNIDVNQFGPLGLDILVKKPTLAKKLKLGKVKYYVGSQDVFSAQNINRVEFKASQGNKFLWKNVESFEVNNRIVFPNQIKGFVIQK